MKSPNHCRICRSPIVRLTLTQYDESKGPPIDFCSPRCVSVWAGQEMING